MKKITLVLVAIILLAATVSDAQIKWVDRKITQKMFHLTGIEPAMSQGKPVQSGLKVTLRFNEGRSLIGYRFSRDSPW